MTTNHPPAHAPAPRPSADAELALVDAGIRDLFEDAGDELARRVEEARSALIRTAATPAERARLRDIEEVLAGWGPVIQGGVRRERAGYLRDEWASIVQSVVRRAAETGDPLHADLAAAEEVEGRLYVLWDQDLAAYRAAYEAVVRQVLGGPRRHGRGRVGLGGSPTGHRVARADRAPADDRRGPGLDPGLARRRSPALRPDVPRPRREVNPPGVNPRGRFHG